jgi:hypothetical protein
MGTRSEIRDFLTSRRARITPEQAGLPAYGAGRRVTGLRREEAALPAPVTVPWGWRAAPGRSPGWAQDGQQRRPALPAGRRERADAQADVCVQREHGAGVVGAFEGDGPAVLVLAGKRAQAAGRAVV